MNIALDYDGTYTANPDFWLDFVILAKKYHHVVHVVTMRYPTEYISHLLSSEINGAVYYTSRSAKAEYMNDKGVKIDWWVDDNPLFLYMDAHP